MRSQTRFALVVATVAALTINALPVQAADAPSVVKVSRHSPYASCDDAGQPGRAFSNAETEPQVASNPFDPMNLIGVYQQDRWTTGGSRGDVAGYSHDGGQTWQRSTLPFSRCAPGGLAFDRATDPWVSIGPDGTAYVVGLSLNGDVFNAANAVVAATSTDGGATWGTVRVIRQNADGAQRFNDKESVTADPTHAGVAYAVWDVGKATPDGHFRQPTLFSRTTDWGRHWSRPIAIAGTAMDEATINNIVIVDPSNGTLYNFYTLYYCVCYSIARIEFVKSTDGGLTWSKRHTVDSLDSIGVYDPHNGNYIRTADFGAAVALDPGNGTLYAAWQSPRFNGGRYDEIAVSTSHDGGQTWSEPRRGNTPTGQAAFTPGLAVSLHGAVGLTYYDFRSFDANRPELPTNIWLRSSWDRGRTWSRDQHVAGPFNFNLAPRTEGPVHFLGDYTGLTDSFGTFVPFFSKTNCMHGCNANPTDIYAARIDPLAPSAAGATAGDVAVPNWTPRGARSGGPPKTTR